MSNAVRNGFSTLNRLFGKKNKDASEIKSLPKSTATLSRSTTNLDTSSQQNKIVPLVAASTNAPFEQTFRITVCLPLDQLYVARVGAKTKLVNLLEMVCTNKLLDKEKFEFRHPIDETQVYDLDMTIGEVGLNEIRLAHKTSVATRQTNGGIKCRPHSTIITHHSQTLPKFQLTQMENNRLSSRTTASPYSSTNSLNSTDSSGMNSSLRSGSHHGPVAPSRKKRVAPRPPSQNSIPEDREQKFTAPSSQKSDEDGVFKRPLLRQNFHVSSPNLSNNNGAALRYKEFHCSNNNVYPNNESPTGDISISSIETNSSRGDFRKTSRPLSMQLDTKICNGYEKEEEILENGNHYAESTTNSNHSRTSSETSETARDGSGLDSGPIPRKRIFVAKKKAPAPPPRSVVAPVATPRNIPEKIIEEQAKEENALLQSENKEKSTPERPVNGLKSSPPASPVKPESPSSPPATPTKTMECITPPSTPIKSDACSSPTTKNSSRNSSPPVSPTKQSPNVSKVMLNVDTTTVVSHTQITAEIPLKSSNSNADKRAHNISKTQITADDPTETSPTRNVSKTNLNGLPDPEPLYQTIDVTAKKKSKSISVVELNVEINNNKNLQSNKSTQNSEQKLAENGIDPEEVSKEISKIINKAVEEINEEKILDKIDQNNNNAGPRKRWHSKPIETSNNYNHDDSDSKPESPLWIYTLPAPPTFADNKIVQNTDINGNEEGPTKFITSSPIKKNNRKDSEENLVENPIKPVIIGKQHIDFHDLSDNSLPHSLSTTDTMTTTGTATDPESLITSDIEDGYQGNDSERVAMKNLENRRDRFIEDEFKFLKEHLEDKTIDRNDSLKNNRLQNEHEKKPTVNGNHKGDEISRKMSNGTTDNRKLSNGETAKTEVIEELNNIISTNRLDSVIRKSDEPDEIDTLKRSSLKNFHIGSYANGNHENVSTVETNNINGHHIETNGLRAAANVDQAKTLAKRSSMTLGSDLHTNETEVDTAFKTPKNIIRSKSFHSIQLPQDQPAQPDLNQSNGFNRPFGLTPRTSSYISLIGIQKFDSKVHKDRNVQLNHVKNVGRQRSNSELSIADSPSLQSLEVMKSILSNSRKNSLVEQGGTFTNGAPAEKESNKIKQNDGEAHVNQCTNNRNQQDTSQIKLPEHEVVMRRKEQPKNDSASEEPKKWKYQGPPAINLSTWGERPKSQVFIKSDSDYKFGGMSKVSALQKRFSSALHENSQSNHFDGNNAQLNDSKPIVRGVEYKKNVIPEEYNGNTKTTEDSVDFTQRPSYEVSRLVSEQQSSGVNHPGFTTMTLGRVSVPKHSVQSHVQPQSFNNNYNSLQRNTSFNQFTNQKFTPVVKGFKPQDIVTNNCNGGNEYDYASNGLKHQSLSVAPPSPVKPFNQHQKNASSVVFTTYDQERKHIEVERPSFSQFALRKTGLKEKILDEPNTNGHAINKRHTTIDGHAKVVNNNRNSVPVPPPKPPTNQNNGFVCQSQQVKSSAKSNALTQQKSVDTKDQLLDSIRNFNRNALKKC